MIDEIEKRSDGRIKITLYDNNTLGTERECAEGTQTGNFDFSIVNMSVMSNFIPEYGVFDLPISLRARSMPIMSSWVRSARSTWICANP